MNIVIKPIPEKDAEVMNFLVNESFLLFCALNKDKISFDIIENLKQKLKQMYMDDIDKDDKLFAAYIDGILVGCAYITKDNYFKDLFVKEEYRNKGIGSMLIKKVLDECSGNITLHTHKNAIDLYKRFSFYEVEEKENGHVKMERSVK